MAQGTVATTELQDSWLSSPSSILPLLPPGPPWQNELGGWPKAVLPTPTGIQPVCPALSPAALIQKKACTQPTVLAACKSKGWPTALAAGMQKCKVKGTKTLLPFPPYIKIPSKRWSSDLSGVSTPILQHLHSERMPYHQEVRDSWTWKG